MKILEKIKIWYKLRRITKTKPDITDLVRQQLKGITIDIIKDSYDGLSKTEEKELHKNAELMKGNEAFKFICDNLVNLQAEKIAQKSKTMESVNFCRGTINGIFLLQEEVDRLSLLYKEANTAKEKFNKYNILAED